MANPCNSCGYIRDWPDYGRYDCSSPNELRDLFCVHPDLREDMSIDDAASVVGKSKPGDCCRGIERSVIERLAIYCGLDDSIYYNADRVINWLGESSVKISTALLRLLGGSTSTPLMDYLRKSKPRFRDLVALVRDVSRKTLLNYLINHERYHWLSAKPGNGSGGVDCDGEALATAFGIARALSELRGFGEQFWRLLLGSGRLSYPSRYGGLPIRHVISNSNASGIVSIDAIIELMLHELTIDYLMASHMDLTCYRGFTKHLSGFDGLGKPGIRYAGSSITITLPALGLEIKLGCLDTNLWTVGSAEISTRGSTMRFNGEVPSRPLNNALVERWVYCGDAGVSGGYEGII